MRLRRHYALILRALSAGRILTTDQLVGVLWGDNIDGGPVDSRGAVSCKISHLRKRMRAANAPCHIRSYGRDGGYELIMEPAPKGLEDVY